VRFRSHVHFFLKPVRDKSQTVKLILIYKKVSTFTPKRRIAANGVEANGVEANGVEANGVEANGVEANRKDVLCHFASANEVYQIKVLPEFSGSGELCDEKASLLARLGSLLNIQK